MKRRRLLQGLAASSTLSLTVGVAAGDGPENREVSELNVDEIEVRRGSEVVRTVSGPSVAEAVSELEAADRVLQLRVQQETGDTDYEHISEREIGAVEVRRDGDVVRTITDPSDEEVSQAVADAGDGERVVTDSGDCVICCTGDYCPCDACLISCSSCDCCCSCTSSCC